MCCKSIRKRVLSLGILLAGTSAISQLQAADVVPFGSSWRWLNPLTTADNPGTKDPSFDNGWFKAGFNVNSPNKWSGPSAEPFVRGTPDNIGIDAFTPESPYFVRPVGTYMELPATQNRWTTYYRTEFTTTTSLKDLGIELLADDGARVYLNGKEVASYNCCLTASTGGTNVLPGTIAKFTDVALVLGNERTYQVLPIAGTLAPGTHTLAVSVHQQTNTSNDMGFSARLVDGFAYNTVVPRGAEYKYFIGSEEPSGGNINWTKTDFNDASWGQGQEPFGYENDPAVTTGEIIKTEVLDMYDTYTTLYLRKKFSVDDPAKYGDIQLTADYDDGFIAFINGTEVARRSVPGAAGSFVKFDALANGHESTNNSGAPPELVSVSLSKFPGLLKAGANNVLSFQAINQTLNSSDFLMAHLSLSLVGSLAAPGKPGDFDGNGTLDAADIDSLTAEVIKGTNNVKYDVNADTKVNQDDRSKWVVELRKTYFGDANLDGQFTSTDFVQVFQVGKYENPAAGAAKWGEGDWSGDGLFTSSDFVVAFQDGGFENGPRAAVSAVPEPTGAVLLGLSALGLLTRRRK